jgi:serine/threonine protein kinase
MGQVWLARRPGVAGIEKICVIKTLRDHLASDREHVQRFLDEARVVVQLTHRNICPVFDVGVEGETYYFAMEFIDGCSLRQLIGILAEQGEVLPESLALYIASELLSALDYAHRFADPATNQPLNLVHRDISPQNVAMNFEGEVKLIDFGLALSDVKEEETAPQTVLGKAGYLAPEQIQLAEIDGRADLFAMGVLLYEMLSGRRFYGDQVGSQLLVLVGSGQFEPEWQYVPERLRPVIERAVAFKPEDRYLTASDFRAALEQLRAGQRAGADELRALLEANLSDEKSRLQRLRAQALSTPSLVMMPVAPAYEPSASMSAPAPAPAAPSRLPLALAALGVIALIAGGAFFFLQPPADNGGGPVNGVAKLDPGRAAEALQVAGVAREDLPLLPAVEVAVKRFEKELDQESLDSLDKALKGMKPSAALVRAHLQRVDKPLQELAKKDESAGGLFEAEFLGLYKELTEAGNSDVTDLFNRVRGFEQRLRAKRGEAGL